MNSTNTAIAVTLVGVMPDPTDMPECFLDVLQEWGNTWMWDLLCLIGDDNWLLDSIQDGTCIALANGSYIREMYPDMCSCAFVLECTQGQGQIFSVFLEQLNWASAYRGKL